MRLILLLAGLFGATACNSPSGACVYYEGSEEGGDSGEAGLVLSCQNETKQSCDARDDQYLFHANETCDDAGFTSDCGLGGEVFYDPVDCSNE
jgi:hypothetical protein